MGTSNLMNRSYRIGRDGTTVVCDATAVRGEIDVLREALAWKRDHARRASTTTTPTTCSCCAAGCTLDDLLAATSVFGDEAPLTLIREQAQMLCELAVSYVAERDVESYQPPEERDRIATLRALERPADGLLLRVRRRAGRGLPLREPPLPV